MRVIIDDSGEVNLDLIGYLGESCQAEEEKLRRTLASLGLLVEVGRLCTKSSQEQMEELRQLGQVSGQTGESIPESATKLAAKP